VLPLGRPISSVQLMRWVQVPKEVIGIKLDDRGLKLQISFYLYLQHDRKKNKQEVSNAIPFSLQYTVYRYKDGVFVGSKYSKAIIHK